MQVVDMGATSVHGVRLARSMSSRSDTAASSARNRSRSKGPIANYANFTDDTKSEVKDLIKKFEPTEVFDTIDTLEVADSSDFMFCDCPSLLFGSRAMPRSRRRRQKIEFGAAKPGGSH